MAFCGDEDRDFVGEVAGPLAVHQGANGELVVITGQSAVSIAGTKPRSAPMRPDRSCLPSPVGRKCEHMLLAAQKPSNSCGQARTAPSKRRRRHPQEHNLERRQLGRWSRRSANFQ